MSNNNNPTQLPVEWLNKINNKAQAYMHSEIKGMVGDEELQPYHLQYAHAAGAKEYATKLHQLQQENEKMKAQATGWRPLLEKVIQRHEGGLLPDRILYLDIKKFLYGE